MTHHDKGIFTIATWVVTLSDGWMDNHEERIFPIYFWKRKIPSYPCNDVKLGFGVMGLKGVMSHESFGPL